MARWLRVIGELLWDWLGYLGFCFRHMAWVLIAATLLWLILYLVSPAKFSWRPLCIALGVGVVFALYPAWDEHGGRVGARRRSAGVQARAGRGDTEGGAG